MYYQVSDSRLAGEEQLLRRPAQYHRRFGLARPQVLEHCLQGRLGPLIPTSLKHHVWEVGAPHEAISAEHLEQCSEPRAQIREARVGGLPGAEAGDSE